MRLLARIAVAICEILQETGRFNPLFIAAIISFTLSSTSFSSTVDNNQHSEEPKEQLEQQDKLIPSDETVDQKEQKLANKEELLPPIPVEDISVTDANEELDNDVEELIDELIKLKGKLVISKKDLDYFQFFSYFENNLHRAEEAVIKCIKSSKVRHVNRKKCRAAVDAVLSQLEVSQAKKESKSRRFKKKIEYFQQYFSQNVVAAKEFLEDTCKNKLFEVIDVTALEGMDDIDEKDYNLEDIKCNIATEVSTKFDEAKKKENEEKQRKLNYIKDNYKVSLQIYNICNEKNIDDDPLCHMVEKIVTDKRKTDKENRIIFKKYRNYYAEHILAAKNDFAECDEEKGAKTNTQRLKCRAAKESIKANKSRKYDLERQEYYYNLFKEDPKEAKFTINVECKEILSDPWYFIDKNLQDEKCNAAVQFFDETQNKKVGS